MVDRDIRRSIGVVVTALIVCAIAVGGYVAYRSYATDHFVTVQDDGRAVSRIVTAKLDGARDLRVGTLRGVVQGVSADTRLMGMLQSTRVMKAPFVVDYFVDLSSLDRADFRWDLKTRTLVVDAPAIRVGAVNIDESRTTLDKTEGLFVTRDAMAALRTQASARAHAVAAHEAASPANLDRARRFARTAIAADFAQPLRAVGIDAQVRVRFPDERTARDEEWDRSRSLADIFAEGR